MSKPRAPISALSVGDRVFYSRAFLKSICASPTDTWWHMEGLVTEVVDWSRSGGRFVCKVRWLDADMGDETVSILAQNLVKKGDRHKEDR